MDYSTCMILLKMTTLLGFASTLLLILFFYFDFHPSTFLFMEIDNNYFF